MLPSLMTSTKLPSPRTLWTRSYLTVMPACAICCMAAMRPLSLAPRAGAERRRHDDAEHAVARAEAGDAAAERGDRPGEVLAHDDGEAVLHHAPDVAGDDRAVEAVDG